MLNWNRPARAFVERASVGTFAVPRCTACGDTFLPPRALCPVCGADSLEWQEVPDARATIYSLTRFADGRVVACVDLDAVTGPGRLTGLVVGDAAIDDRVRVVLVDGSDLDGIATGGTSLRAPAFEVMTDESEAAA